MKKLILLLSIISLFCQSSFAQTGGLNFQGVARNATGAVLANQKINLKFSILKTTETGTVEYTETKEATTNAQGIFAVVVGEVNATSFAAVDWKVTPKFLKVEMDAAGGTSFITMGTTRLQNVPYAYYANGVNANNIDGTVPVSKGGTGASDAAAARTNLGLVIGTDIQTPLKAGTDYLTPTGNAATATKLASKRKINGVDFDGSEDISVSADAGTISGTISIAKGGTGASTGTGALTNLGAESIANKSTDITLDASSLTKYPSVKSIKDYVDTRVITGVSTSTDLNITSVNGLQLGRGAGNNLSSVAIGGNTLTGNTTGFNNNAIGNFSLNNNTTGGNNVANGTSSLRYNTTGYNNIAIGVNSLTNNISGNNNTAVGNQALAANTTANSNTAIGTNAMAYNTTGWANTAIGHMALTANTTGYSNVALGMNTMSNNTSGWFNTASGIAALNRNTTGSSNTANGTGALSYNTTGFGNTAIGMMSLEQNTTGGSNTASGIYALSKNTTGLANTASGESSLLTNTTGWYNTANGSRSLYLNEGSGNTSIGYSSLYNTSSGTYNSAIGYNSGTENTIGSNNTFVGANSNTSVNNLTNSTALGNGAIVSNSNTIQLGNTFVTDVKTSGAITALGYKTPNGSSAQYLMADGTVSAGVASATSINGLELGKGAGSNTTNIAVGNNALRLNTTGQLNTATGFNTLYNNTTGEQNTAVGSNALRNNTTGNWNSAIGSQALLGNTTGVSNTAIGNIALASNSTGSYNTAIGAGALYFNTTGSNNYAIGNVALFNNTTGSNNTATGVALFNNTTGSYNTATGVDALSSNTTGMKNTAYGYQAGVTNTIGNNNTFLGNEANVVSNNLSNATAIGYQAEVSASNTIQLGNTSVTDVKTSGTITSGTVTYPNNHGTNGQVLTTTGSGTLTWTTPQPDYSVGINLSLGGYVIYVTPNGKHGLVVPLTDQTPDVNNLPNYYNVTNIISDPSNYDVNAKNFTDWRLPTKYEIDLMYTKRNEIGNFVNITGRGGYWSSTEWGANNVKYYLFFLDNNSNLPTNQTDTYGGNIRAIRSF